MGPNTFLLQTLHACHVENRGRRLHVGHDPNALAIKNFLKINGPHSSLKKIKFNFFFLLFFILVPLF